MLKIVGGSWRSSLLDKSLRECVSQVNVIECKWIGADLQSLQIDVGRKDPVVQEIQFVFVNFAVKKKRKVARLFTIQVLWSQDKLQVPHVLQTVENGFG